MVWNKTNESFYMRVGSVDLDVLERLRDVAGGTIVGPYKGQGARTPEHYKPMYMWSLSNFQDIEELWEEIKPLMSLRRCERFQELVVKRSQSTKVRRPDSKRTRPSTRKIA